jgi:uncharacterized protein YlxW (UPF0749 family)
MEPNEVEELKEHAEHGSSDGMRPVAFTMSVVAVLVAVTTVLGHRTHTEAVLNQNRATDQWNYYQDKKILSNDTALAADLLSVVTVEDKEAAKKIAKGYADHQQKWAKELADAEEKARDLEKEVRHAERKADRFDLSEALLEIGLVVSSVTLLTKMRFYWYVGMVFSLAGVALVVSAFLLR